MSSQPSCMGQMTNDQAPMTKNCRSIRMHGLTRIARRCINSMTRMTTEARNPASEKIDTLAPLEIVRLMNAQDALVAEAVGREAEPIAQAVQIIADRLRAGGRL